MNLHPIVVRELRAQARQSMTYWVRSLVMAVALVAIILQVAAGRFHLREGGGALEILHRAIFWTIWICAPLLTADCLSRERREGTLGLLFLTPLRGWEVVAAKGLAQGLRCASLLLAAVPALTLPILLGGVGWPQVAFSAVLLSVSLVLALSAGLVASSLCRIRHRAFTLALLLAGGVLLGLTGAVGGLTHVAMVMSKKMNQVQWDLVFEEGWATLHNDFQVWDTLLGLVKPAVLGLHAALTGSLAMTAFVAAMAFAASRLRRAAQENAKSQTRLWLEDFIFLPAYAVGFYYRWLKQGLQHNPIGWLEKRRWSGRAAAWAWLAVGASFIFGAVTHPEVLGERDGLVMIKLFVGLLIVQMTVTAAMSFDRERSTGVMELLLVTPISEAQIIRGRLRGLWTQFLPGALGLATAGLLAYALARHRGLIPVHPVFWREHGNWLADLSWFYLLAGFVMLPVFGLYYSLCLRHTLAAPPANSAGGIGHSLGGQRIRRCLAFGGCPLELWRQFFRQRLWLGPAPAWLETSLRGGVAGQPVPGPRRPAHALAGRSGPVFAAPAAPAAGPKKISLPNQLGQRPDGYWGIPGSRAHTHR